MRLASSASLARSCSWTSSTAPRTGPSTARGTMPNCSDPGVLPAMRLVEIGGGGDDGDDDCDGGDDDDDDDDDDDGNDCSTPCCSSLCKHLYQF